MVTPSSFKNVFFVHIFAVWIDLTVRAGEVHAIMGPNGSGKSTLLRCCNRLEEPSSGSVVVDGIDLLDPRTDINRARQRIGMVFQGFNLLARRTVYGNVALPLEIARVPAAEIPAKVERLLALVGLDTDFIWRRFYFLLAPPP